MGNHFPITIYIIIIAISKQTHYEDFTSVPSLYDVEDAIE